MIRRAALLQNVSLAVASVVVAFVVLEVAVRLLVKERGGKEQREAHGYAIADPVLGWKKRPRATISFSRRDFVNTVTMNSEGLRDRERPVAKPPGEFRVLALGDSFVEAYMMKDDETPSARLRYYLASACGKNPAGTSGGAVDVDVINGGTFGYSTDQEYLVYDRDLHRYGPDVVVLFTYHNDLPPNLWGGDKPQLDFSTDPPRVANEPVASRFPQPDAPLPPEVVATPAEAKPFLRSDLLALVRSRLENAPPSIRPRLEALGVVRPLPRLDVNDEIALYSRNPFDHLVRAFGLFEDIVVALRKRVERDGAKLLIAYVPARFEVNPEDWERTKALYRIGDRRYDVRIVATKLAAASERSGIPFVDLTEALRATRGVFAGPYFATDSHWNAIGADAGARAVAGKLRELGWVPGCGG